MHYLKSEEEINGQFLDISCGRNVSNKKKATSDPKLVKCKSCLKKLAESNTSKQEMNEHQTTS